MPRLIMIFLLLCIGVLWAKDINIEPGYAVIKLRPEAYIGANNNSTGIADLDILLTRLGVKSISPRFQSFRKSAVGLERILLLGFDNAISPIGIVNALKNNRWLEYAEPLYIDEVFAVPDDTHYAASLNFAAMYAEAAWDIHKCEDGITPIIIGIVDSGVAWKHPDLAENIWNNLGEDANANGYTMYYNGSAWVMDAGDLNGIDDDANGKIDDLIGWNMYLNAAGDQNNDPNDPGSHGTMVAGLAGARTNNGIGVASISWNPVLLPVSCARSGATSSIVRGYDGIIYAAENGARIVNCSWGGTAFAQASSDVIDHVWSLGTIVVAAAGNSNNAIPLYPAAYKNVVATASLQNTGAKYSSSNFGGYIDVGAPNVSSYSTSPATAYTAFSGTTSYASPIAAGLAALIWSKYPSWTPEQVIHRLKSTCTNINSVNPGKENLLGSGMLNALAALTDSTSTIPAHLDLQLFSINAPTDENANLAIEPGETFSMNLTFRNFSETASNATFTLSSSSPYVTINNNTAYSAVPIDDWFDLTNAFSITVSPTSISRYITFTIAVAADDPIYSGSSFTMQVLIQNGGIFVWEAKASARNQSGNYLKNTLQTMGKTVVYGNTFPASLYSFDAVFLSYGAIDGNNGRLNTTDAFYALVNYLEAGGKLYAEGADAIGFDVAAYFPLIDGVHDGDDILWPLFGIAAADDGTTNTISNLAGQIDSPVEGQVFTSSNQTNNTYIDTFVPDLDNGRIAFTEDAYGDVAISSIGDFGQKTFVFSYALAELVDGTAPNTKADLVSNLMAFFLDAPIVSISENAGNIILQWSAIPMADKYEILHSDSPDGAFSVLVTDLEALSYELSPAENMKFYKVRALP